MATKVFQHFLCMSLITFAFPLLSHARPSKHKAENPTSFDYSIKNLEGSQKGQTVKGLHYLKTYLEAFGYLNYSPNQTHANNDNFDDAFEAAVKSYQLFFHLNTTGTLDTQTVSQMMEPRCGVPDIDIVNYTNWMQASQNGANSTHNTLLPISLYSLRGRKWPSTKYELTYAFRPGTNSDTMSAVSDALNTWSDESPFTFTEILNFFSADLRIGYYRGDHGDGLPFNGRNGAVAHAFYPPAGLFHYNADRSFSLTPSWGKQHLETVALHEIGHVLGLGHSTVREAIMFPTLPDGKAKGLNDDDIRGIQALYTM